MCRARHTTSRWSRRAKAVITRGRVSMERNNMIRGAMGYLHAAQLKHYMKGITMSVVIDFPDKEQLSFRKTEKWIRDTLGETELSKDEIDEVIEAHKKFHEELNPYYKSVMQLPNDIGLSENQLTAIKIAHNECIEGIFNHFLKLLAHSQHIIIGLLAREKLKK